MADLQRSIEDLWAVRAELANDDADARALVHEAIELLDTGKARIAEVIDDEVVVHEWLKHAVLLLFKLSAMETVEVGPFEFVDKIPLKRDYAAAGVRVVPGASARWGSFLERDVIMMPSYVNIGARVGTGTMVDTWATTASSAAAASSPRGPGSVTAPCSAPG
jgi:2,3,4,5-tetrahydropyridine-2-carboxylate N-succinyltransferase